MLQNDELNLQSTGAPDTCHTVNLQYAEISIPVELKPNAFIGGMEVECIEVSQTNEPTTYSEEREPDGTCSILVTQTLHLKIPVTYKISTCIGNPDINCCHKKPSE